MTLSLLWWLVPAIGVFWAVGAHNRLVRLRSSALRAYAALHAAMARQSELLQSALPPPDSVLTVTGELMDPSAQAWRGLQAALTQFEALLAATRGRALDPEAMAALAAARGVLAGAWQRVQNEGHDLAGSPVPDGLLLRWDDVVREVAAAATQFNTAVDAYNHAVRQFPALLLAWVFGFRAAQALGER